MTYQGLKTLEKAGHRYSVPITEWKGLEGRCRVPKLYAHLPILSKPKANIVWPLACHVREPKG